MVDVSLETGVPGSYILSNQPHSWQSMNYLRPDGGSRPTPQGYRLEASNLIILKNVPEKLGATPYSIDPQAPTWHWYAVSTSTSPIASGKHLVTSIPGIYWVSYGTTYAQSSRMEVTITGTTFVGTSLSQQIKDNTVNVFPNPSKGVFNISFTANSPGFVTIEIKDVLGNIVIKSELYANGAILKSFEINKSGIYFVTIYNGEQVITKKVTIE